MIHYEKVTREEIARRNYTEGTTRAYLRALHGLADNFHQPPEQLTREQIREYTAHLISDRKLSGNTVIRKAVVTRLWVAEFLAHITIHRWWGRC